MRLLEPWPLKFILDRVIVTAPNGGTSGLAFVDALSPTALLTVSAVGLVIIIALRAAAEYASTIGFALIGNRVLTRVRGELYEHLQRLSLSYHTGAKGGDLTLRVISDVGMLKEIAVTAVLPMLGNIFILIGMLAVMFLLQWQLALIAVAIFPIFWLVSARQGNLIREVSRKQRKREGAMAAMAAESIGAIKIVQALSLEPTFNKAFLSQNQKSLKEGIKAKRLATGLERTVDVLIATSTALVLFFGARLVLGGALTPGDLIVFITYLKNAFKPMRDFAKFTGRLAKASAAGERVLEILDREPDIRDAPGAVSAPPLKGAVHFEGLSFAYDSAQPVLKDIDIRVNAGERVAIVGPSGSGKSTLASLLPRLYDPEMGRVTIDGRDIRDYTLQSLRGQISVVLQDNLLFGASVRDNIAFGVPGASDEEVDAAARLAHAHDFIMALPKGYATVLGERGATLSGGQRQRIAVARAAIRKAPILILDEPTVGLDEENERWVSASLDEISKAQTTLLITHDLGFAARADRVVYIENGQVLEEGNHEALIRLGGRYATLYRMQLATEGRTRAEEKAYAA
ncbi:MAG: ABC transporter ATP-binding protein/permease [Deinococcota bacterium]|nr:ABC transporter ATP-binding protein/permease [Deinococcota bacterium]